MDEDVWWNPELVEALDAAPVMPEWRARKGPVKAIDALDRPAPVPKFRKKADAPRRGVMEHFKRQCNRCHGSGRCACQICNGSGQGISGFDMVGNPRYQICNGCVGTKLSRCLSCGGEGFA